MILVADSGSTKTDWMMDGEIITENGINPVTMCEEDILTNVRRKAATCTKCRIPVATM